MAQFFMGFKPGVGPVIKDLVYDTDDPLTLSNDAYDRYYFNSETQNLSYLWDKFYFSNGFNPSVYPSSDSTNGNLYVIEGSSASQARRAMTVQNYYNGQERVDGYMFYEIFARFPEMPIVPIYEAKLMDSSGRVRVGHIDSPDGNKGREQTVRAYNADICYAEPGATGTGGNSIRGFRSIHPDLGYTGWVGRINTSPSPYSCTVTNSDSGGYYRALTCQWDLPANNAPIPAPGATPVVGQEMLRISPSIFVLTRRGFEVDNSAGRQRLIDSARIPNMCVMMGQTDLIQANSSVYVPRRTEFPLHESMFVDTIIALQGLDFTIPAVDRTANKTGRQMRVYYRIDPNGIAFSVEGDYAVYVRYMIYATSTQAQTSGGSAVMRSLEGGHVQIKRPGSSDNAPSGNDVLFDTRFPSVRVMNEGWIPASSFSTASVLDGQYGSHAAIVNFNGTGQFIFPKVMCNWPARITQGFHQYVRLPNTNAWQPTNQSCVTVVQDNRIVIHISPGAPTTIDASSGGFSYTLPDPIGVRYHVLSARLAA
ncbi:hypothetical protein [Brucella tritici]|uniref:hypothetical protein n=1 Tax=Brucella tritici TaxID=94626 RepID=UPI003D6CA460